MVNANNVENSTSEPVVSPERDQRETVNVERTEIAVRGKKVYVPSITIDGRTIVVAGRWIRMAEVWDEELVQGEVVREPELFMKALRSNRMGDIFSFGQKLTDPEPKYHYHLAWDNAAVIRITTFEDWWENRLPQESRKNVRRSEKRGVVVKEATFNDELVTGIQGIYNETPTRQGRPFWHYGKPFDVVKQENGTYLERSDFIGAYVNEDLIGFIKIIHVDRIATLIQILSKNAHSDKRPMNALLTAAVKLCERKGVSFLVYGKYTYDGNLDSPLTEFKRRNGFEEIKFPRYFVPLTLRGEVSLKLGLHRGIKAALPQPMITLLRGMRARYRRSAQPAKRSEQPPSKLGDE
jgi:hypothetical protein